MHRSVMTPASYAFGTFKRLWAHWGGEIGGGMRHGLAPARRPLIVWQSRTLAELIRPLNKWSNNVMTRMLLYSLAAAKFKPPFTKAQGIEVLLDYLRDNGLDATGLVVDNGSGLSRDAHITAELMNALLRHAYAAPYMPEFIASMSINGLDGTARRRFAGRPEAGHMHLKTGRIDNVAAIAGYVKTVSKKNYTVALMINHQNIHHGAGTEIQNAVLKWVYEQ
jgi:D-alanyl-D-alanine carboxypeptidase/D-alanyl-D-alanine-endopeptidase (penicillin-binding protein 4)